MKRLLLFFAVIFALNSVKAQMSTTSLLTNKDEPRATTIKEPFGRDGIKKITYNLKSNRERYEYYIHNPLGKKIPKVLANLEKTKQEDDEITFIVLIFYLTFAPGKISS